MKSLFRSLDWPRASYCTSTRWINQGLVSLRAGDQWEPPAYTRANHSLTRPGSRQTRRATGQAEGPSWRPPARDAGERKVSVRGRRSVGWHRVRIGQVLDLHKSRDIDREADDD